jgi:hypothetical protein
MAFCCSIESCRVLSGFVNSVIISPFTYQVNLSNIH